MKQGCLTGGPPTHIVRPANLLFSIFIFSKFYGIKKHPRLPFLVKPRSPKFPLDRSFTPFIVLGEKGTGHLHSTGQAVLSCTLVFKQIPRNSIVLHWQNQAGETGREERNISDKQNLPAIGQK
jgi:hypothetical protein